MSAKPTPDPLLDDLVTTGPLPPRDLLRPGWGRKLNFSEPSALTHRQQVILDWIRQFIAEHGHPPTLREIGKAFGIKSTNGVNDHLRALERKGFIIRTDSIARSIVVVNQNKIETPADAARVDAARVEMAAENAALRKMLGRVVNASVRLPSMTAEMAIILGDLRAVLGRREQ